MKNYWLDVADRKNKNNSLPANVQQRLNARRRLLGQISQIIANTPIINALPSTQPQKP